MKRNFYNTKLKKLLLSILLVIILMSSIMPNVVFAATEKIEHLDYDFSYKDWLDLRNNNKYKDIIEKYGSQKYENELKEIVIEALCKTKFYKESVENPDEAVRLAEDLILNNPDGIMVNGTLNIGTKMGFTVCKFEIKSNKNEYGQKEPEIGLKEDAHDNATEQTMKYNELLEWSGKSENELDAEIVELIMEDYFKGVEILEGDASPEDASKKILELNKEAIVLTVVGNNDNYTITDFEVPGKDEYSLKIEAGEALGIPTAEDDEEEGDLGGWLLEPVFMLVNFIFDSLTGVLGEVMTGEWGFAYDQVTPSSYNAEDVVQVDVSDFGTIKHFVVKYTPEEIFSGKVDLLSIDFISGTKADGTAVTNEGWLNIRSVIAQWYKVLRMIAIIGFLSVLIYTGIKIIISANAKDKAKYKEWIINWFIAVAILFSMHYIMAFITSVTGEFSNLLNEANGKVVVEKVSGDAGGSGDLFETNLMGLVRFRIQSNTMAEKIAYEVMYIALFIYTVKFTFVYLKRVLNMAFLTLIAPIVALTYPIDKVNDGNAQGFNMWLKEYIFNALLQPMHLILYYILVGSAIGIAASNPIYGIVVLAFMTQAEDLLKKIFGYNKAGVSMANGMTGAFAAGAIAAGIKDLARLGGKGSGGGNGDKSGGNNPVLDNPKPTEKNDDDMELFDDPANESESQNTNENNDSDENKSAEEKMFDADEENGVFDDDPEYREYLERGNNEPKGNDYSDEELRERLREQGWSEEEINDTLNPTEETEEQQNQQQDEQENEQENEQEAAPNTDPIEQLAEEKERKRQERLDKIKTTGEKIKKGGGAVLKRIGKPIWDADKSKKYNFKRLARNVGRLAIGTSIGITAAAVQAGISITDGKYTPKEGLLTFAAGYTGGGRVVSGIGSIGNTFMEGYNSGDKQAAMEKAQERWHDRDDVIKYNKKYAPEEREMREERQTQNYLPQGITDLSKMDSCMKYADEIKKEKNRSLTQKQLDTKARIVSDFMDNLEAQGMKSAIRDADKRKKYIETVTRGMEKEQKAKIENRYNNLFIEAAKFQDVNKK